MTSTQIRQFPALDDSHQIRLVVCEAKEGHPASRALAHELARRGRHISAKIADKMEAENDDQSVLTLAGVLGRMRDYAGYELRADSAIAKRVQARIARMGDEGLSRLAMQRAFPDDPDPRIGNRIQ